MTHMPDPTRRDFLFSAAGVGIAAVTPSLVLAAQPPETAAAAEPSPPEPQFPDLRIAYIGVGGIGGHHLEETVSRGVRCEAFCDVDIRTHEKALEHFPNARGYQDYRRMFDKEHENFDAVMIGTPDHHHYPATMMAMQLGKHVYTQKPLAHTPWECRHLLEASRRYSRLATQMGNQGHAGEGWRLVLEWVRGGALGEVFEVHTWTDRPIWPQGMARPEEEDVPPRYLDWDAWVGPAPMRPFRRDAYHRFNWRGWWDFGCGALGDMACHTMDGFFWAMEPGAAKVIEPLAQTPMNGESFPKSSVLRWEFSPRSGGRPLMAYWYDGGLRPCLPPELEMDRRMPDTGSLFIGTEGKLLVAGDYGQSPRLIPEPRMKQVGKPAQLVERSPGHVVEWLLACTQQRAPDSPGSNFAYAAPMSETILLGNIAMRLGRRLEWDAEVMRFINVPEANAFVTKEYRSGWNPA